MFVVAEAKNLKQLQGKSQLWFIVLVVLVSSPIFHCFWVYREANEQLPVAPVPEATHLMSNRRQRRKEIGAWLLFIVKLTQTGV